LHIAYKKKHPDKYYPSNIRPSTERVLIEGSARQSRAQFVRTSSDTEPATLSDLLYGVWKLPPPKLVITIHGGLQPKLARIFRKGILKVARSTNAWIITSGLNADLGSSSRSRNRIIAIGVAPWGMLKGRSRFIGTDISVHYAPNQFSKSRLAELNDRHSYFIFADNGTVGRYGPEIILRKRIETYLAQQNSCSTPVVCVVLEGGAFTIKVVYDYVASIPHIPVVICDGSGGAADLLAFTHHALGEEGRLSDSVRHQLVSLVEMVLNCDENNSNRIVQQLIQCARQRDLVSSVLSFQRVGDMEWAFIVLFEITVFRMGEQRQDVDHAVFTALLKGQNLSPSEQLQLALAWNRADIARSEIFTLETDWSIQDLHNAMMEALSNDRTDFVQLLLDNGVSMHSFLTFSRLEHLYNLVGLHR
uniref:LSDAT_euk domain-containing protein n=1 Tax=Angiostrongylus costaricensis TaxID=334426 RepID=A0A0R3PX17_ANGCS